MRIRNMPALMFWLLTVYVSVTLDTVTPLLLGTWVTFLLCFPTWRFIGWFITDSNGPMERLRHYAEEIA